MDDKERMKIKQDKLSHDGLVELLNYNPETGIFTNRIRRGNRAKKDEKTGCLDNSTGYIVIVINKNRYRAHRLAWFYVHKIWPGEEIDHKNLVRHDNRLVNLRLSTHSSNMLNKDCGAEKQSFVDGINWNKNNKVWQVYYNCKYLGSTKTIEGGIQLQQKSKSGAFIEKRHNLGKSGVEGVRWNKNRGDWHVYHDKKYAGSRKSLAESLLLRLELANGGYVKGLKELYTHKK